MENILKRSLSVLKSKNNVAVIWVTIPNTHTHVYTHVYTHTHTDTHRHVHTHTDTHTCMHTHTMNSTKYAQRWITNCCIWTYETYHIYLLYLQQCVTWSVTAQYTDLKKNNYTGLTQDSIGKQSSMEVENSPYLILLFSWLYMVMLMLIRSTHNLRNKSKQTQSLCALSVHMCTISKSQQKIVRWLTKTNKFARMRMPSTESLKLLNLNKKN